MWKGKICLVLLVCERPFRNKDVAEDVKFDAQSITLTFAGNEALPQSSSTTTTHGLIYYRGIVILC